MDSGHLLTLAYAIGAIGVLVEWRALLAEIVVVLLNLRTIGGVGSSAPRDGAPVAPYSAWSGS